MTEPLARVNVEIGADTTKLESGVESAKQTTEQMGDKGAAASQKLGKGFEGAAKRAERLQSIVAKIFIPAAVFAAVARLVRLFRDLQEQSEKARKSMEGTFEGAQTKAMEFRRRGLTELQQAYASLNDEQRKTEEQIRKIFEEGADPTTFSGLVQTIFGTSKDYDDAVKRLGRVYAELRTQAKTTNLEVLAETRKRLDAEVLENQAAVAEIQAAELEAIGNFEEAAKKRQEALSSSYITEIQKIKQAGEEFQRAFGIEGEQFRFMRQALEDLHKLRIAQVKREAKESADAYEREMGRAIDSIQGRIRGSLGISSGGLEDAIRALGTELQRRSF